MKTSTLSTIFTLSILLNITTYAEEANVHHVVLFDLKDGVTSEEIEELITVGEALLAGIPGVLEVSINKKAREDRAAHIKDYDIALYVLWESNGTGSVYAPHILHQAFLKLYRPMIASVKVIDFYGNVK